MEKYISSIILFSNDERRIVPLEPGVNIISGDSKTGKSALVEIVDYCLCSSRSTIPKGIITDFTELYCITLVINKNTYVIARKNVASGGKMFLSKENEFFKPDTLTLAFFKDKPFQSHKDVQYKIESALGMFVSDLYSENNIKSPKASLRNMVSYMFQHQNLIANKFALFYRFNDYYKRKDTIEQFPVFAGLVDQEYYSKKIRLNELEDSLKKINNEEKLNMLSKQKLKESFLPLITEYFTLLNIAFNKNITLSELIHIAENLPEFSDLELYENEEIWKCKNELENELTRLKEAEIELRLQISEIKSSNQHGNMFVDALKELQEKTELSMPEQDSEYMCPLCGCRCESIIDFDKNLFDSKFCLENELNMVSKQTSAFDEDLRKLSSKLNDISVEIIRMSRRIKKYNDKYINSNGLDKIKEQCISLRGKIDFYLEILKDGILQYPQLSSTTMKDEIAKLKFDTAKYNVDGLIQKAENKISENMSKLAKGLDFESEYGPISLTFKITDDSFNLYNYQNKKDKIFLYEMGSGANWVSSHIALFLSLMRYFCDSPNSPMLTTMFFDQPSQVYFPDSGNIKNSADVLAVEKMYNTIFKEINSIKVECLTTPQLIIVDHVSGNELNIKKEFLDCVRADWRDGKALI